MSGPLEALTIVTALGCGLSAGAFFAFSSFVMQGLARLAPAEGAEAMQAINVTAVTPAFMTALFAPAAACLGLLAAGLAALGEPHGPWLVAGAALYLVGPVGLTIAYHVPRNDALAGVAPSSPGAAPLWARYQREWTRANHVRAAAALAAAAAFTLALVSG